jgi:halimadienyl-diphosphate synthase
MAGSCHSHTRKGVNMQRIDESGKAREETRLQLQTQTLLQEVAGDLDSYWGGGDISPSGYETAWVAMVRDPRRPEQLAFPESLEWLLRSQQRDGGWQGRLPHSMLPTLAARLALAKAPRQTLRVRRAGDRAEKYLGRMLPRWDLSSYDSPLIEFLLPVLIDELAALGVPTVAPQLSALGDRRIQKLKRLPLELLYSGRSNLIHGLEGLSSVLDYNQLRRVQSPNGGYGNSPSATASVLIYGPGWDSRAAGWLRRLVERGFGGTRGAMPSSHPADTFEVAWVLHFLQQAGQRLDPKRIQTHRLLIDWLQECLADEGASFARSLGLPADVDDTAMVLAVLQRCGVPLPLDRLWHFETPHHFVSYAGERISSTTANAHVLEALLSARPLPRKGRDQILRHTRATRKLVDYLSDQRDPRGYWLDKWHLSPYYATLSCVLALARAPLPPVRQELSVTLDWLLETQDGGGGWCRGAATAEETAYALLALRALEKVLPFHRPESRRQARESGRRWLGALGRSEGVAHAFTAAPALWIDKSTYAPARVIRAAILAALR